MVTYFDEEVANAMLRSDELRDIPFSLTGELRQLWNQAKQADARTRPLELGQACS